MSSAERRENKPVGCIIARGKTGHEAFNADQISLGLYPASPLAGHRPGR
jgi:hypothetical protein